MRIKLSDIILFIIVACFFLAFPSHAAINLAVSPPATSAYDSSNGTARTISGVLPGDFKENEEVSTPWGSYSNKTYCNSNQNSYTLKIRIGGDLTSGGNTIPYANMKYIYTYAYNITNTKEATGTKNNYRAYVPLSTSDTLVYTSGAGADETPVFPAYIDWEHQFKYAIQVPNNQPPGTYTGTITYTMNDGTTTLTKTCNITVTVGSYFRLSVDRGSVDFEKMRSGETKDNVPVEGVIVTGKTNTGNPWYLKISNDSPLSSGPYTIPNTNFIWYGWTDGAGKWYGTGANQLTFVPDLIYSSSANEGNNMPNGTNNHLKFKLTIPKGQPGGKYLSNVKLTLTE